MTLQIFLGETRDSRILWEMERLGWGRLWSVRTPRLAWPTEVWAFDNGAYSCFLKEMPFDEYDYQTRLDRALDSTPTEPSVAVVPDIIGGGLLSLEFSLGWRDRLPNHWPWYLAVQDGMTAEDVAPCLDSFEGLFLGGTTRFKSTAEAWCALAHEHDKRFHYGRASVLSRVRTAQAIGADSLDTSFPLWTRGRLAEFMEFVACPTDLQGLLSVGPGALSPQAFRWASGPGALVPSSQAGNDA